MHVVLMLGVLVLVEAPAVVVDLVGLQSADTTAVAALCAGLWAHGPRATVVEAPPYGPTPEGRVAKAAARICQKPETRLGGGRTTYKVKRQTTNGG